MKILEVNGTPIHSAGCVVVGRLLGGRLRLLVQLARPEVSIDVRRWSYSTPFTHSGRFTGEPTGIGLDTEAGIVRNCSENDLTGLSFLSFVYPKKKWSVAVYRRRTKCRARGSRSSRRRPTWAQPTRSQPLHGIVSSVLSGERA